MAKRKKKKTHKLLKSCISLLLVVLVGLLGYLFQDELPFGGEPSETTSAQLQTSTSQTEPTSSRPHATLPGQELDVNGYLEVHYIDVGQGDSILVRCDGKNMLIDAGDTDSSNTVIHYLNDLSITSLDLVIGTHAHADHIGEMGDVLNAVAADEVWYPDYRAGTKAEERFLTAAENCGATVRQPELGESYALGGASVTVLGPVKSYSDVNDHSLIIMVRYGESKFLFTGDMEKERGAESDLVEYWGDALKADVLKVGHHGSDTSSSYLFLRTVSPSYAVISVGAGNKYAHPCQETLDILGDAALLTYRTDYLGSIVASSDGSCITFRWERTDAAPYIPE